MPLKLIKSEVKQLRIIILAEGDNKIGMGHVYRSLNLAKELRKNGYKIIFLTNKLQTKKIISKTFSCRLSYQITNKRTKNFLNQFSPDIIILDKLHETQTNLSILRKFCPILGIDYTGKNKNLIDYGINILYPKSGISKNSYSGLDLAILDKKFQRYKKKKITRKIKSILILQGGSDTNCFTPKIIQAVLDLDINYKISIVLGPSFSCWSKLDQVLKQAKNPIKIHYNVSNMSLLMQKADLAVTAGGNTLLELACIGIPSLIVCAEKFEVETARLLQNKGFGINAGFGGNLTISKIHSCLINIINDYNARKKMNAFGPKLIDGKGSSRVVKILKTKITNY